MVIHEIGAGVLITVTSAVIIAIGTSILRKLNRASRILEWAAREMVNDGNGSWRSSIDKRLTAIEMALPGVQPKPENPKPIPKELQ